MDLDTPNPLTPKDGMPLTVRFIELPNGAGRSMVLLNRFNSEPLEPDALSTLAEFHQSYKKQRFDYNYGYLHLTVDGEEVAIFSPKDITCEPFSVPYTASFLEVIGEDLEGEMLLAVFPFTHLDLCKRIDNYRASVPCGDNQLITLFVSSLPEACDEPTHWMVRLEFSQAGTTSRENTFLTYPQEKKKFPEVVNKCELAVSLQWREPALPQPNGNPLVRIVVVGIGSSGSSTVDKLIESGVRDVTFAAINTDLQALRQSRAPIKVQLAPKLACGLGTGGDVEVGRTSALESTDKLVEVLQGADMVFITTGLGGGTGTGAAPVIAGLARDLGALTVSAVTMPFGFEGTRRARQATAGLRSLCDCADTVITLPNDALLYTLHKSVSLQQAFDVTYGVMQRAVQSILDLVAAPGLINLDFADVRTVMANTGSAFFGTGRADGDLRALCAVEQAMASPQFNEATLEGAKGVLVNVTGGNDLTLHEVNEAATIISEVAGEDVNLIFGAVIDESMRDEMKITIIATGFEKEPSKKRLYSVLQDQKVSEFKSKCIYGRQDMKEHLQPSIIRKLH
jgi:cell division protein FtsZ